MNNPLQAMLWELWRTSRTELFLRVAGLSALVVLLWLFGKHDGPQLQVVQGIAMMLMVLTSVFSHTWQGEFDNRRSGFSFRLGFTRPATTATLVVVPMLFLAATAVASFLIPAVLFRLLFSSSFPLAGPATWVAVLTCCLVAATWSAATGAGKRIAIIAAACGCALAFVAFHVLQRDPDPFLLALGKPRYFDLAWHQYLTLLAAAGLATAITIKAVDRQRHDVSKPMIGSGWRPSLRLPLPEWRGLLSRPLTVQCWYEFRRFGITILLLSIAAALLVFATVSLVPLLYPRSDPGAVSQVWLFALAVCPLAYQLVGADGAIGLRRNQGATRLSDFDATRPMPNDRLIAIKMLVIAACSLFGWLCMAVAAAMHASLAGNWQGNGITSLVGLVEIALRCRNRLSGPRRNTKNSPCQLQQSSEPVPRSSRPLPSKSTNCGRKFAPLHPVGILPSGMISSNQTGSANSGRSSVPMLRNTRILPRSWPTRRSLRPSPKKSPSAGAASRSLDSNTWP